MNKVVIASDHGGFELKLKIKEYLLSQNYDVLDLGTDSNKSCDYPYFAKKLCSKILSGEFNKGILICGTGLGMSICANRFKDIRAACVSDTYSAKMSRLHNNSNVLCLGSRVLGVGLACDILDIWLNASFEANRHQKRLDMIDE